jgi:ABC-type transport system involved in multi-copper enzyme maturation permease subunit
MLGGFSVTPQLSGSELFSGALGAAGPMGKFPPVLLSLFTLFLGAGLISEELESGHAQLVLLRPLTRAEWFGGRLLGSGLCLLAVMTVTWLFGAGKSLKAGEGLDLSLLLSLPIGFIWAFAWLSTLAALSVVSRGWMNTGWVVMGVVGGFLLFLVLGGVAGIGAAANKQTSVVVQLSNAALTLLPYVGPQSSADLVTSFRTGAPKELWPLLYDLFWAAAAWLLGVVLLNQRELARRRP